MCPSSTQTCEDLSAPYFLMTGDCELGVRAVIHFGSNPLFDPQTAVVRLDAPGCNRRNGCAMTYGGTDRDGRDDLDDHAERALQRRLLRTLEFLHPRHDGLPGRSDPRRHVPERRASLRGLAGRPAGESGAACGRSRSGRVREAHDRRPRVLDPNYPQQRGSCTRELHRHCRDQAAVPGRKPSRRPCRPPSCEPVGKPEPGLRLRYRHQLPERDRKRLPDDLSGELRRLGR